MQNQPLPSYHHRSTHARSEDDPEIGWNLRLAVLFSVIAIALVMILGRLAYIQTVLPDDYVSAFNITRTEREVIPGRDGRILTDNAVMATDVVRYDVEAHYRWLERPANTAWLTQRARARLTSKQRRSAEQIEQSRSIVLATRDGMWRKLIAMGELDREALRVRCLRVQKRVERMLAQLTVVETNAEPSRSNQSRENRVSLAGSHNLRTRSPHHRIAVRLRRL